MNMQLVTLSGEVSRDALPCVPGYVVRNTRLLQRKLERLATLVGSELVLIRLSLSHQASQS